MIGRVVSVKMKGSATVLVARTVTHPLYKKTYAQSKKYLVEDSLKVSLGDIVEITKVKPISKMKHWSIVRVIGKNIEELVSEHLLQKGAEAISEVMPEEKREDGTT